MRPGLWITFVLSALSAASVARAEAIDFDKQVAPLLAARCLECHNPTDRKGKLDLTTAKAATAGGKDGPVIVPGNLDKSLMWENVRDDEMPPKKPLKVEEKAILKAWIAGGAKWGKTDPINPYAYTSDKRAGTDWWSLQPVKKPQPPQVKRKDWARNPIDAFVLEKLEAKGLSPAPQADPRVLARRIYFDLIGLPPTPAEIDAFVKEWNGEGVRSEESGVRRQETGRGQETGNEGQEPRAKGQGDDAHPVTPSPPHPLTPSSPHSLTPSSLQQHERAVENLIDRLLASPHYGERWAQPLARPGAIRRERMGFEYESRSGPMPGTIATTSSTLSTATSPTTFSSRNRSQGM